MLLFVFLIETVEFKGKFNCLELPVNLVLEYVPTADVLTATGIVEKVKQAVETQFWINES